VQDNSHESKRNRGGRSTRQHQKKRITIVRPEDSLIFVTFGQSGCSSGRRPSLLVQQQETAEGGAAREGRGQCRKGGLRSEQCRGQRHSNFRGGGDTVLGAGGYGSSSCCLGLL
jgi:hypothetical protein